MNKSDFRKKAKGFGIEPAGNLMCADAYIVKDGGKVIGTVMASDEEGAVIVSSKGTQKAHDRTREAAIEAFGEPDEEWSSVIGTGTRYMAWEKGAEA